MFDWVLNAFLWIMQIINKISLYIVIMLDIANLNMTWKNAFVSLCLK